LLLDYSAQVMLCIITHSRIVVRQLGKCQIKSIKIPFGN